MVAPRTVLFYDAKWDLVGHKCWHDCPCSFPGAPENYGLDLNETLSIATGIDVEYLSGFKDLQEASIACKMSWAAWRMTTKSEDQAYCLYGLFDISMPISYGEGKDNAFRRLQEELLRKSNDQSIFAWTAPKVGDNWPRSHMYLHRLLSPTPLHFLKARPVSLGDDPSDIFSYSLSNNGIKMRANSHHVLSRVRGREMYIHIIRLNCVHKIHWVRDHESGTEISTLEIAITDGKSILDPDKPTLFYRVFTEDLDTTIQKQFPQYQRSGPVQRTFYLSANEDSILSLAKL